MARKGGQSTAAGVSFQALAIARSILDVYLGQAEWVRAELPPRADFGEGPLTKVEVDDYVLQREGRRVYNQAKSSVPGERTWTVGRLLDEDILQSFHRQVSADPSTECRLVTPCPCLLLGELAERARSAESADEYVANLGLTHQSEFKRACQKLKLNKADGYAFLKRCCLETRAAEQLRQDLEAFARDRFADPETAADSLFVLAHNAMARGPKLDRSAVTAFFDERAVFPKPSASDAELLGAVRAASSRLRTVGQVLGPPGHGIHLLQPTVDKAMDWIAAGDFAKSPVAALLDQAGSGKTVAMSVLLNRLEKAGWVVLGIKVDGLSFANAADLANAVGLPAPIPSVIQRLRACGHRVAVLIDQVDALSSAMSQNASAIAVILDTVARLVGLRDVPIFIACRSFDWRYDCRIRELHGLNPLELSLPELSDDQLDAALGAFGIRRRDLHPSTMKIVRCPLRLGLLIGVVEARRAEDPAWSPTSSAAYTLQSLYEEFWTLKLRKATSDGKDSAVCEEVVTLIAERMHDTQELSVPAALVTARQSVVDWLRSEDVLTSHGKMVSFFHQTFFDFIYARQFAALGNRVIDLLLASDQGLFYRPMVRQILEYKRGTARSTYLADLGELLRNPRIRSHLRWLIIAWLGQVPDPWPEELACLEPFLLNADGRRSILSHCRGNGAWFDLLTPRRLEAWLDSGSTPHAGTVMCFLDSVIIERQDEVADLLTPYVGRSSEWNDRVASCLARMKGSWGEALVQLLKALVRSPLTHLDQGPNSLPHWARALETLAKHCPQEACEVLGTVLERFLPRWDAIRGRNLGLLDILGARDGDRLLPEAYGFEQTLQLLAENGPAAFLDTVLPWAITFMDATCRSLGDGEFRHNRSLWGLDRPRRGEPTGKLLAAMEQAARRLAGADPDSFRETAARMSAAEFLPFQHIVAGAYAAQSEEYASDAAAFLSEDRRRLRLDGRESDLSFSVRLIQACGPHWSAGERAAVEQAILGLRMMKATSVADLNWRGLDQLHLLRALGVGSLGPKAANLLGQLERKFPAVLSSRERRFPRDPNRPPIPDHALRRMSDKRWLAVMKAYAGTHGDDFTHLGDVRLMLAGKLSDRAKEEPGRFCSLALERMDASYHSDYSKAIIGGTAEGGLPIEQMEQLIRKYRACFPQESIRPLASAIGKYTEQGVTPSLVTILADWALHARDPEPGAENGTDSQTPGRDLTTAGMNTDRGEAVWALAKVYLEADPPRRAEYLDFAEGVVGDHNPSVRAVCLRFLRYTIGADPSRACGIFQQLVGSGQELLREDGAYDFVYRALFRSGPKVLWAIEAMILDGDSTYAQENGAKLACLAAFRTPEAHPLRDRCLQGPMPLRRGAAVVYATNIADPEVGRDCRERLGPLMNDAEPEVRGAASSFFDGLHDQSIRDLRGLVLEWSLSRAIEEGASECARMLEKHPSADPELTLSLAERMLEALGSRVADNQIRHGLVSYELVPAILNVYQHVVSIDMRTRAMDLFDRLGELGCGEVASALEAVDRL